MSAWIVPSQRGVRQTSYLGVISYFEEVVIHRSIITTTLLNQVLSDGSMIQRWRLKTDKLSVIAFLVGEVRLTI